MARTIITPPGVPAPKSPLSPGVRWGNFVFTSGQVAPESVGVEAQTRAVLEKLGAVLRAAGTDFGNVVRCTVYLADIRTFDAMNSSYREVFSSAAPARTTIECKMANPAILVEIDCIAGCP